MKTELRYRTFQEVLESAVLDIPAQALEGMVEPQQLLKLVIKINYELGLRINPVRTKLLELRHGKAKLPDDFSVANYALLCGGGTDFHHAPERHRSYTEGLLDGVILAQDAQEGCCGGGAPGAPARTYEVVVDLPLGTTLITHPLNTDDLIVQALTEEDDLLDVQVDFPDLNTVSLTSESGVLEPNVRVTLLAAGTGGTGSGGAPTLPSVVRPERCELLGTTGRLLVKYHNMFGHRRDFHRVEPLRFARNRGVSAECQHLFAHCANEVTLQNGFLVTGSHQDGQHLLLSYQSVLESEDGELLTLDHPKVNEYYEYALKAQVFENMYLAGEDVLQKLQYLQSVRLRPAKIDALSFINTPDFADFKRIWDLNRRAQTQRYYSIFQ